MNEAQRNEYPVDRLVKLRLRHYGNKHYSPKLFTTVCDVPFRNKPKGGLWTSPINSTYGWSEWCKDNGYDDLTSYFDLEFEGTVFEINSFKDMNNLPWIEINDMYFVSFEQLMFMGYDAVYLTDKGQTETRLTHPKSLYGWDCETVLIMNANSIKST